MYLTLLYSIYNMLLLSLSIRQTTSFFFFFFNDTATTEIYTLSLHDALPIYEEHHHMHLVPAVVVGAQQRPDQQHRCADRKSTRLNSSHLVISYAVFCLKKKKKNKHPTNVPHRTVLQQRDIYHQRLNHSDHDL